MRGRPYESCRQQPNTKMGNGEQLSVFALRLDEVGDVHGHLFNLRVVKGLQLAHGAHVVTGDEVDGHTFTAETIPRPSTNGPSWSALAVKLGQTRSRRERLDADPYTQPTDQNRRLNLNRSWHKGHSHAYNTSFYIKSYTKDLSLSIFGIVFQHRLTDILLPASRRYNVMILARRLYVLI
jgi:hypothetical protein